MLVLRTKAYWILLVIRFKGGISCDQRNEETLQYLEANKLIFFKDKDPKRPDYILYDLSEDGHAALDDRILSWIKAIPIPVAVALIVELLIHK